MEGTRGLPYELVPPEEIARRVDGLRARMERRGVEVALVAQNVDIFYLSGTLQRGFLVVPLEDDPVFFVQQELQRASLESPLRVEGFRGFRTLKGFAPLAKAKRVGLEFDVLPVELFFRIQKALGERQFVDLSGEILRLRAVKSPYELEQLRRSARIVDRVFSQVPVHLREGMAEVELDALLQAEGRKVGHQGWLRMRGLNQEMANIVVLSGESGAFPSYLDAPLKGPGLTQAIAWGSSWRRIGRDEPVVVDYGGGHNGYTTDETRTFVLGKLPPRLVEAYNTALQLLKVFEDGARPGVNGRDLYEECLRVVRERGLEEHFMGYRETRVKFIAHGLGLEINERPVIAEGRDEELREGMVVAVEPKFVFPGVGAVGVEVDYAITERGPERLSTFPTELVQL